MDIRTAHIICAETNLERIYGIPPAEVEPHRLRGVIPRAKSRAGRLQNVNGRALACDRARGRMHRKHGNHSDQKAGKHRAESRERHEGIVSRAV